MTEFDLTTAQVTELSAYLTCKIDKFSKRMGRKITDEEYTRWVFLLGKYYKGQCLSEL
jgi:hypothetical protein